MDYESSKILVFLFLALYFVFGFAVPNVVGHEVYPFFNWHLFSRVPQAMDVSYKVRIISVEGKKLPGSDNYFLDMRDDLIERDKGVVQDSHIVTKMGRLLDKNLDGSEDVRKLFEENLSRKPVVYEVLKVEFPDDEEILERFTVAD